MSASMERRLSLAGWIQLRLHLLVCAWCRRYLSQIKLIRRVARMKRAKKEAHPSVGLSAEARSRIIVALSEVSEPGD